MQQAARNPDDAHVRAGSVLLDDILCLEYDRRVSNDYIVRLFWKNKTLPAKEIKTILSLSQN